MSRKNELLCRLFNCDKPSKNICCDTCYIKYECKNRCHNIPERCGKSYPVRLVVMDEMTPASNMNLDDLAESFKKRGAKKP